MAVAAVRAADIAVRSRLMLASVPSVRAPDIAIRAGFGLAAPVLTGVAAVSAADIAVWAGLAAATGLIDALQERALRGVGVGQGFGSGMKGESLDNAKRAAFDPNRHS